MEHFKENPLNDDSIEQINSQKPNLSSPTRTSRLQCKMYTALSNRYPNITSEERVDNLCTTIDTVLILQYEGRIYRFAIPYDGHYHFIAGTNELNPKTYLNSMYLAFSGYYTIRVSYKLEDIKKYVYSKIEGYLKQGENEISRV